MELKPKQTESRKKEYEQRLEAHFNGLLEPGESLQGFCSASQQTGLFSGGVVSLATTDRRLIVQTLDRKGHVKSGEVISIAPEEIASAKTGGAGGAWDDPTAVLMDRAATKLKIKTTGGAKLKFMLMDGTGVLGSLGGGETQRQGAEALMDFLGKSRPSI